MSSCNECGRERCRNVDDCWYLSNHPNGCNYCHCDSSEEHEDYENDYSANITLHNLRREQADAAVHAAVDAVEALRQEGQPRHDGTAIVDKTERILSSREQKRLNGSDDEDED